MKKDLIYTFVTQFIILASGVLVYKLAAVHLGKAGFAEYALSRRTMSLIQPAMVMGLGVGIPRYIAISSSNRDREPDNYFIAGFYLLLALSLVITIGLFALKDIGAFLLFGDSKYSYLVPPISLMLVGMSLHVSCYSFFRGKVMMRYANLIQVINIGIVPLLIFFFAKDIAALLIATGAVWIAVCCVFLLLIYKALPQRKAPLGTYMKELVRYGVQRVPGDLAMAALMTLPATFTAHLAGVKEAGYVAFGISLVNMAGGVFAPIGLVLLPKTSLLIAERNFVKIEYYVKRLLNVTAILTVFGFVVFEIFADELITVYLGHAFSDIKYTARVLFVASLAYNFYVSVRSVIDAFYVKSVNTKNILVSLLAYLGLSGLGYIYGTGSLIAVSFVLAISLLGLLTLYETFKILKQAPTEV